MTKDIFFGVSDWDKASHKNFAEYSNLQRAAIPTRKSSAGRNGCPVYNNQHRADSSLHLLNEVHLITMHLTSFSIYYKSIIIKLSSRLNQGYERSQTKKSVKSG